MHVGTFTTAGTFAAAADRLPHLEELGVTAVEIMPVAQFPGSRGWGYDGVLLYAPHQAYGSPDEMRAFVDAAHELGLMVLLDVVYSHFGPEGNYLPRLAPAFFHRDRSTPWGSAIAYERRPVRQFFIDNALYWLEDFRLDGLRLDATDQIRDAGSDPEFLVEIAVAIRERLPGRQVHLTTEDNRNVTYLHEREADGSVGRFTAEWNDDFHNAAHVIATGETDGYYEDYARNTSHLLARALAEGFAFQGEASQHLGLPRGQRSGHLPPAAFIDFLQNHDQIGNRAFGERLTLLAHERTRRVLSAILLLSPHIPLLFMGEEWGETRPFYFFTDFGSELADAVREGRRKEFARFPAFSSREGRSRIPDPNESETFHASRIDWNAAAASQGSAWLDYMRSLLELRRRHVVPLLRGSGGDCGRHADGPAIAVDWDLAGGRLQLRANVTGSELPADPTTGMIVFSEPAEAAERLARSSLPGLSVVVAAAPEAAR
jgi:malto-oligosyltrehalose trehalohydrolase